MDADQETSTAAVLNHVQDFRQASQLFLQANLSSLASESENKTETAQLAKLTSILDLYQEQSYLLDPFLEEIIKHPIQCFVGFFGNPQAKSLVTITRIHRLARLIYYFTKVRGPKVILTFFPHRVEDLDTLLSLFASPETLNKASWEVRYVLLLWLSLVVMIPFKLNLVISNQLQDIPLFYLRGASKERDAAAMLLARYYSRPDANVSTLLQLSLKAFSSLDHLFSTGLLSTISQVLKYCSAELLSASFTELYELVSSEQVSQLEDSSALMAKYRIKLVGRTNLLGISTLVDKTQVSEETETCIGMLLQALQSRDGIVRYSAAKYVGRVASQIPQNFVAEIIDTLVEVFDIDSQIFIDEEAIDHSWHGACLTFAELARRSALPVSSIGSVLDCIGKALLFDKKRGSQSLGSSVRDSAAYALWALSRVVSVNDIQFYSLNLAHKLVCVSLFDREIHIRRAASAAFQECVGRWGVFPHGLELLKVLDFVTVGLKRRSFLEAAPEAAIYEIYREPLITHIMDIALYHYDAEVRKLAGLSLGKIVAHDPQTWVEKLVTLQLSKLDSKNMAELHGVLVSLQALAWASAPLLNQEKIRADIWQIITSLSPDLFNLHTTHGYLNSTLIAVLDSLCACVTTSGSDKASYWWILSLAAENSDEQVQKAGGKVLNQISRLRSMPVEIISILEWLDASNTVKEESAAFFLGSIKYNLHNADYLPQVVNRLNELCKPSPVKISPKIGPSLGARIKHPKGVARSIESRKNGINSLSAIWAQTDNIVLLDAKYIEPTIQDVLDGFKDYTVDRRGDVGSWVRAACVSFVDACLVFLASRNKIQQINVDLLIGSLLKQCLERLDSVRVKAISVLLDLVHSLEAKRTEECKIQVYGAEFIKKLNNGALKDFDETSAVLFPLIKQEEYKSYVLEGAILGVALYAAGTPFLDFALDLPQSQSKEEYTLQSLLVDLASFGTANFVSNRLFIPWSYFLGMLLATGELDDWEQAESLMKPILGLVTRGMEQIKNYQRLSSCAKIATYLLNVEGIRQEACKTVGKLLKHPNIEVRVQTSEDLFQVILAWDEDIEGIKELTRLVSETQWRNSSDETTKEVLTLLALIVDVM